MTTLTCLLATPEYAADYCREQLDKRDCQRVSLHPNLEQREDWRVSRFLKQQVRQTVRSLSHSHGFAAVLASDSAIPCGVDIEKIRPRDFAALATWICSEQEYAFLQQTDFQAEAFYRLWCVKEALIKAADLDFPADMKHVGYVFEQCKIVAFRVQNQTDWHGLSALFNQQFACACVWCGTAGIDWQIFGQLEICEIQYAV